MAVGTLTYSSSGGRPLSVRVSVELREGGRRQLRKTEA